MINSSHYKKVDLKKFISQSFLILSLSFSGFSQIPEGFPVIGKDDISEAKFLPSRYFAGEALFGYMNGGAELYLEYGISSALITEFDLNRGHYKCEIFRMNGREEAFGILSVLKFRCLAMPSLAPFSCQTKYQLQICKGQYYINIINKSGTSADSVNSLSIGKIVVSKIIEPAADLSVFLPGSDPGEIRSKAVLSKGKLGLMNGATAWEDYFKDITGYSVVILPENDKTIISVRFVNRETLQSFIVLHNWDIEKLTTEGTIMAGGELVKVLAENHLLIETGNWNNK